MFRIIGFACTVAVLFSLAGQQHDRFSKFPAVKAYEICPGVLAFPSYADDGRLCQTEIEKRHYVAETAILDSKLPYDVMIQIIDELVPPSERGKRTMDFGTEYISLNAGNSVSTFAEYENVSINMFREATSVGEVVAIIKWKHPGCPATTSNSPPKNATPKPS